VEPFQMIKTVVTATEYDNFYWLRNHSMAQPEIQELARCMLEAQKMSIPVKRTFLLSLDKVNIPDHIKDMMPMEKISIEMDKLEKKSYHLPYVSEEEREKYDLEDCIKIAVARCAAVSYRNEDYPLEKCREVYNRLIADDRKHSSAMEHVAQVMFQKSVKNIKDMKNTLFTVPGISHMDKNMNLWSGNFKGWIQHRKLIEGECCWKYVNQ
jgi:thymidylate synthase ThyX